MTEEKGSNNQKHIEMLTIAFRERNISFTLCIITRGKKKLLLFFLAVRGNIDPNKLKKQKKSV